MSAQTDWEQTRDQIKEDISALINLGVPLETARRLTNWSLIYEHTWAEVSTFPPPVITPPANAGLRDSLRLLVARSAERVNPGQLEGAQLDAGKLYAVFIPQVAELGITNIVFKLDGVPHHTEASAPWDYDGTLFDGSANRVTFVSGSYEIEATITDSVGIFSIAASFNVE